MPKATTPPPRWAPPSMREHLATLEGPARAARIEHEAPSGNHTVRCAICRRRISADMCVDVRQLPPAMRRAIGLEDHHDFACDACRGRWIAEQRVEPIAFHQALGAPPHVLTRLRDKARAITGE